MEQWKTIEGFDNYKISTLGNVKNKVNKKLSIRLTKEGYNRVRLYGNVIQNKCVHRLVAEAFISNEDKTKNYINHIDGNKLNNNIDNLEWVNHSENMIHCRQILNKGVCNIKLIKDNKIFEFNSIRSAADELNLDRGNLSRLFNNKINHCKGYKLFQE
jgi:hypothetical protein